MGYITADGESRELGDISMSKGSSDGGGIDGRTGNLGQHRCVELGERGRVAEGVGEAAVSDSKAGTGEGGEEG